MPNNRPRQTATATSREGRLTARPATVRAAAPTGLQPLGLHATRDALLYVPASYDPSQRAPLAVMFHGAGGNAEGGMNLLRSLADDSGVILLAPASQRQSWDVIHGGYGADIAVIDHALTHVFERYAVDPARIAVGGFSDGASYALSVGITNGDLFTHVAAFSPGFMAPASQHGAPRIYISHGVHDDVLPIDRCSRRIVPQLERAGYDVQYHEFDGPHTVPPDIARESVAWLMSQTGA